MTDDIGKLCNLVRSFPLTEGENKTTFPYLSIYLSAQKEIDMPKTENFYIYTVLEGSIRLFTPSGIMDYMPGQYSVSKIDTPLSGHILTVSENGYFLAVSIELTLNDVITVLLDLDGNLAEQIADSALDSKVTTSSDSRVISSIYRLVSIMSEPVWPAFMGIPLRLKSWRGSAI